MLRRFITNALILFGSFAALYMLAFWLLCKVEVGGTPLIYRCGDALNWKGGNSYRKFQDFDPGKRYDVVFIGSSHAYRGYDPGIFKRHGYESFNLGTSAQSPLNSFAILEHYLTKENTGLILLDTYEAALEMDGLESTADLSQNISSDAAAVDMALALRDPRGVNMLLLRWMRRDAPVMFTDSSYLPGGSSLNTDSVHGTIHYVTGKPLMMQARQQRYLRSFLTWCKKRGIPVVLVGHPYPKQADRKKHEQFEAWLREEVKSFGYPLYDFAFDHGLPLDDRDNFYDHNHLNRAGVEIFNPILIDQLERDGLLEKNSGD